MAGGARSLARSSKLNVQRLTVVKNLAVKCQRADAGESSTSTPRFHQNVGRAWQRPPPSAHTDNRAVVVNPPNDLVIIADGQQLPGSHQPVMSRE